MEISRLATGNIDELTALQADLKAVFDNIHSMVDHALGG